VLEGIHGRKGKGWQWGAGAKKKKKKKKFAKRLRVSGSHEPVFGKFKKKKKKKKKKKESVVNCKIKNRHHREC
jgi:hypothetical protein